MHRTKLITAAFSCMSPLCADTCYVLSFAIIMLNTSLHNPNVRDKPGLDRFISMNRGINEGGDLPEELLRVWWSLCCLCLLMVKWQLTWQWQLKWSTLLSQVYYHICLCRISTIASKMSPSRSPRTTATTWHTHSSTRTERAGSLSSVRWCQWGLSALLRSTAATCQP